MGWFSFQRTGGCCCGATSSRGCSLSLDSFDRPDDTDLGPLWDEAAGAAEIVSSVCEVTGANTQVIGTKANFANAHTTISVNFRLSSGSATARLFVGWADTSSYLYATISATAITVGAAGGGSESTPVAIAPGVWYTATLCYTGTNLIGQVNGKQALAKGLTAPGQKHGFGAGTASVSFDVVTAYRVAEACRPCNSLYPVVACASCLHNEIAEEWEATVAGVGRSLPAHCLGCADLNGIYLITNVDGTGAFNGCGGGIDVLLTGCGGSHTLTATMAFEVSPVTRETVAGMRNIRAKAGFRDKAFAIIEYVLAWRSAVLASSPVPEPYPQVDCTALDGTVLNDDPALGVGFDYCDRVGSTVTIRRVIP